MITQMNDELYEELYDELQKILDSEKIFPPILNELKFKIGGYVAGLKTIDDSRKSDNVNNLIEAYEYSSKNIMDDDSSKVEKIGLACYKAYFDNTGLNLDIIMNM